MAHERCPEEEAEAILSNLKMEGRRSARNGGRKPPRKTYDSIEYNRFFRYRPEVQAPGKKVTRRIETPNAVTPRSFCILRLHGGSLVVSRVSGA